MLSFLPIFPLAQTVPPPVVPQEIVQPQEVRPLPGGLNSIPVFNSNSPELVLTEGILLSTFPPTDKQVPTAHLNFPFQGRFDLFIHHIAQAANPQDLRTLYIGVIIDNPSPVPVTVDILQAASYLSQPDAPFIELSSFLDNSDGKVYAGPGSRVMSDILRVVRPTDWPAQLVIPPNTSQLLMNYPIPVKNLKPPLNGRSTLIRARSNGPVYLASLGMFGKTNPDGSERAPNLGEWEQLLNQGGLAGPRDRAPTPPGMTTDRLIYGRVAGVAQGSQWLTQIVDSPGATKLTIPQSGQAFSYGIATLAGGMMGTNQIQSAKMLVRYPDTAYLANGNYGIEYNLTLPLDNPTEQDQTVVITIQTPFKTDDVKGGLRFLTPPGRPVFFRGTVRIRYNNEQGFPSTRFVHLVQHQGQQGEPLVQIKMKAHTRQLVQVGFLYPPDATPPQVLTIKTLAE